MRWLLSGGWGAQASTNYPPTYGINLLPMIAVRHLIRDNRVTQIFCTTLSQNHIPASAPPSRAHAGWVGGQGIIILTNAITRARGGGVGIRGEDLNLSLIPCRPHIGTIQENTWARLRDSRPGTSLIHAT